MRRPRSELLWQDLQQRIDQEREGPEGRGDRERRFRGLLIAMKAPAQAPHHDLQGRLIDDECGREDSV